MKDTQKSKGLQVFTLIICLFLFMSLFSTSVLAQEPADQTLVVEEGDSVYIGVAVDLSNILPAAGLDIVQSVRLAIEEVNEAGGINGFPLRLEIEDDLCEGDPAVSIAENFVELGNIAAVIGHLCSGSSIPASDIYEAAMIPMVSPSSTAGIFTARGLSVTNRTTISDNVQGVVAGRYIVEMLEAEAVIVIHNGTSYGEGLAQTVADTIEAEGGEVLLFEAIDPEAGDYTELFEGYAELDPDLIFLGGYDQEGAVMVQNMQELGLIDITFFSGDGIYTQDFIKLLPMEVNVPVYSTFGTPVGNELRNDEFDAKYEALWGAAPDAVGEYHAEAYDAIQMIVNGLADVAEVDDNGNLIIDRGELVQAIRNTDGYEGLSGTITCDENGDCGTGLISVYQLGDEEWITMVVPDELQVEN